MSVWTWPDDWIMPPDPKPTSDGMILSAMCNLEKRFQHKRTLLFRRCAASGEFIWPGQTAWVGIMIIRHSYFGNSGRDNAYAMAWLTEEQYVLQKLKGTI